MLGNHESYIHVHVPLTCTTYLKIAADREHTFMVTVSLMVVISLGRMSHCAHC